MKRLVAFFLILIIVITSVSFAITSKFLDLRSLTYDKKGNVILDSNKNPIYVWNKATSEINKATAIGLIAGYEDGTFRPDNSIARGEFIKMAMVLSTNYAFDFEIVPTTFTHWAAKYVAVAEMQRVLEPGEYNIENIDKPITRIEMICVLSKIQINMKGISQYREANLPNYTDINDLTEEEKALLLHAARYELLSGMFDTQTIKPHENLTRADAVIAIMRIY